MGFKVNKQIEKKVVKVARKGRKTPAYRPYRRWPKREKFPKNSSPMLEVFDNEGLFLCFELGY